MQEEEYRYHKVEGFYTRRPSSTFVIVQHSHIPMSFCCILAEIGKLFVICYITACTYMSRRQ